MGWPEKVSKSIYAKETGMEDDNGFLTFDETESETMDSVGH